MTKGLRPIVLIGIVTLVLAACGSSGGSKSSPPATKPAKTTTTTAAKAEQTVTITPSTGLTDGQTVTVVGKGFTPGATNIGANECADKGDQTGAGDCDLGGTKTGVVDASGTVTIQFVVKKGPFGANNIVCSATVKCIVSVSQLIESPTEVATGDITFAG
ncbi:MAG: neocarzinostatin apoprotein domain-containing protein [Acidimicrobiia bacterium]